MRTARLVGEALGPQHRDALLRFWADPQVTATLGGVRDEIAVRRETEGWARHWNEVGYGLWWFREATTGADVGRGGLARTDVGGPGGTEVAYGLFAGFWGRGLAGEMVEVAVATAAEVGLAEVVGFTLVDNGASRRVLERAGFVVEGPIAHAGRPHVLYRRRLKAVRVGVET